LVDYRFTFCCSRATVQMDGQYKFVPAAVHVQCALEKERKEVARVTRMAALLRNELPSLVGRHTFLAMVAERDALVAERDTLLAHIDAAADIPAAISSKSPAPLIGHAAATYLRVLGFPPESQPAGLTCGLDSIPPTALSASSELDGHLVHPGCKLLYRDNWFSTTPPHAPGEWVQVDLGVEQPVVGVLVSGFPEPLWGQSMPAVWDRFSFQWSMDGTAWTNVEGGKVWSRAGAYGSQVSPAVFAAPVHCRYVRIVAVSASGTLRWEVVLGQA